MSTFKYLIIGGGIAGTTAAETLRKNDSEGSIALVSDEPYPLYSRVLLSKPGFLRGEQGPESAFLKKPEWYEENKIHFISGVSAAALDSGGKTVTLSNGEKLQYEKLLLATGAHARKWPLQGADKQNIFYLRTLDDAKKISGAIKRAKHALLIGSGFVSFEMSDILNSLHVPTTLIMREKFFGEPLTSEKEGKMLEKTLEAHGVKIYRESEVIEIVGNSSAESVILKNGTKIECDMILCMIGIVFPNEWLKETGILFGRGIIANEYLETSVPDVWTAGDGAEYNDTILKETICLGNWMNSRAQGETAAFGMLGQKKVFSLVSFQTSHGFGDVIGFAGDVRPLSDRTMIFRGNPETNSVTRLILRGERIVGTTLINRIAEMGTIVKLIEKNTDVSAKQAELADVNFDLKTLL